MYARSVAPRPSSTTPLLARAKRALGVSTTRTAIEEALRRAVADAEGERADRAGRQTACLEQLSQRADLDVLASEEMWR